MEFIQQGMLKVETWLIDLKKVNPGCKVTLHEFRQNHALTELDSTGEIQLHTYSYKNT